MTDPSNPSNQSAQQDGVDGPLLDLAGGDAELDRQLRTALEIMAEHSTDPRFHDLVDDVLDGVVGLREAVNSDVFTEELAPLAEEVMAELDPVDLDAAREAARGEAADRAADEEADNESPGDEWNVRTFR